MFLRKPNLEPLPVTMSSVRMGERVLQIGIDNPAHVAAMAAKAGLSGTAAIVVGDEAAANSARSAAAVAGALIDVHITAFDTLPFGDAGFDVVVMHAVKGLLQDMQDDMRKHLLADSRRVLRVGGRIVVVEAARRGGIGGWLHPVKINEGYQRAGGTIAALQSAGFKPVRVVGEREGYRFIEGLKT